MTRNIIVFSDGTGNSAASTTKTNVWRLYEALDLTTGDQIATFDDGVGTSSIKPLQYLGLAVGYGLKRNVINLYKFICRNYQPGDRIYAFGFSRGAFTIRVLNGLIGWAGLVTYVSDEQLDDAAEAVYRAYRTHAFSAPWLLRQYRKVRDLFLRERDHLTERNPDPKTWIARSASRLHMHRAASHARLRQATFIKGVRVHFIGIWDTVAAYGLPIDELTRAVNAWFWPMRFDSAELPYHVDWARHALALDDERRTFFPIPWLQRCQDDQRVYGQSLNDRRLLQVWFTGMHANVGGGYADDRLAHVSLTWMIDEASRATSPTAASPARHGLRFKPALVQHYRAVASHDGRLYDSRAGAGVLYRYHPRQLSRLMKHGAVPDPTQDSVPLVHDSVILRMADGADRYAPVAIDTDIDILTEDNIPIAFRANAAPEATTGKRARIHAAIDSVIADSTRQAREDCRQRGLDCVWWRRVLYFVMLGLVALLAAFPLLPTPDDEAPGHLGRFLNWITALSTDQLSTDSLAESIAGFVLSPVFIAARFLTAGQAEAWIKAYETRPFIAGLLGLTLWWVYSTAGTLAERIHDWTAAAWNSQHRARVSDLDARRKADQQVHYRVAILSLILAVPVMLIAETTWSGTARRVMGVIAGGGVFEAALAMLIAAITLVLFASGGVWALVRRMRGHPTPVGPVTATPRDTWPDWRLLRLARWCRQHRCLIETYETIKFPVLPFAAIAVVMGAIAWLPGAIAVYHAQMWSGMICQDAPTARPVQGESIRIAATDPNGFRTSAACWASGVTLAAGHEYEITLSIPPEATDWFDKTTHSDIGGFPSRDLFRRALAATKRSWGDNWFAPIARVGAQWGTAYSITRFPAEPDGSPQQPPPTLNPGVQHLLDALMERDPNWRATRTKPITEATAGAATLLLAEAKARGRHTAQFRITPDEDGQLFLYVNDSINLWPDGGFYQNNTGTADVTVRRVR